MQTCLSMYAAERSVRCQCAVCPDDCRCGTVLEQMTAFRVSQLFNIPFDIEKEIMPGVGDHWHDSVIPSAGIVL